LAGCSAGGVAAVLLADEMRARIQARARGRVLVVALADSSVFPDWPSGPPPAGLLEFPQFEWIYRTTNASHAAPRTCASRGLGWRCLQVGVALPHVATPVFLLQSAADSWHVRNASDPRALTALAARMREALLPAVAWPHAAAVDACFHHCAAWGDIRWGGESNAELFGRWYAARRREWLGGSPPPAAYEGWPSVHLAEPWVHMCYPRQEEHRRWHEGLTRF